MVKPTDDLNYFARRAETECLRAAEATDARARQAHEMLAAEYAVRAKCGVANDDGGPLLNANN